MTFREIYSQNRPIFSFEFFPPKEARQLDQTKQLISELTELNPDFMTVTYGAGGGKRALTQELVAFIQNNLQREAVAHLTAVGHSAAEIKELLMEYRAQGIEHILALRGDIPKEPEALKSGRFSCARDLVHYIKDFGGFSIAVAGYPETHQDAESPAADISYLREKCDAGAEVIMTQLFFDPALYLQFVERCRAQGITAPIVPGILPIRDLSQLLRVISLCGASIPEKLEAELVLRKEDKAELLSFGTEYTIKLCKELLAAGAPGIHLFTLNNSLQSREVFNAIRSPQPEPSVEHLGRR
ncbi:methylenetetrahydrofolate reductase [NAD(P)H] [bacterium]|nr:methylenetetrahydrofolate reductase [NAD(P)H] [bacterium]